MISAITLADADGSDISLLSSARKLTSIQGLAGLPGVRDVRRERPNADGSLNESKYLTDREIVLEGVITGSTETAVYTEFDALQEVLGDAVSTERTLKWTRSGSSLQLQAEVKCGDVFDAPLAADFAGVRLPFQITLVQADPLSYSQTLTTATGDALSTNSGGAVFNETFNILFSPSGGGTASFTNSGTRATPVVLRIYGECTSPQVLLVETGERMVFTGTVAAGDYLEVDTAERTVKLNGTTSRLSMLDYENTDGWLKAPRGATSTFRLLATSFDGNARVDAIGRSAWL